MEKIYRHSPAPLQDLYASLYGFKLRRQRFGSIYRTTLDYLARRRTDDLDWLHREQQQTLASLLNYCRENSSYYGKLLPDNISTDDAFKILAELPYLTKEALRREFEDIVTIPSGDGVVANTGGTTGASLRIRYRAADIPKRFAILHHGQAKFGIDPLRCRKATFSGRELITADSGGRFWRNNWAYNQRLYSTFHLTQASCDIIVDDLNRFRPEAINGFVSAILQIAKAIRKRPGSLSFKPLVVFTTSEVLSEDARHTIGEAFGCAVCDQYGSAEGAPIAIDCPYGRMHLNTLSGIIEHPAGLVPGEACITSLTNWGTPLLRYLIGDVVNFSTERCPCGSLEPVIAQIGGRSLDFLYASDGSQVSASHISDVVKGIPNSVRRVQFIQNAIGSVRVLIEADTERFKHADLKKINAALGYRFGSTTDFDVEIVGHIPVESSGKFRMIKNHVPR